MKYLLPISLIVLFAFSYCEEHFERTNNYDENSEYFISVKTLGLMDSSAFFVTLSGSINQLGQEVMAKEYGFCWTDSTNEPTLQNRHARIGDASDTLNFSYRVFNLSGNTFYHYRSYVISSNNTVFYGDVKAFKTLDHEGIISIDTAYNTGFNQMEVVVSINYPDNLSYDKIGIEFTEVRNPANQLISDTLSSIVLNGKATIKTAGLGANVEYYIRAFI